MEEQEALLRPAEVAKLLGVSPKSVTRWGHEGKLTIAATTPGGHTRYRASDLESFRQQHLEELTQETV